MRANVIPIVVGLMLALVGQAIAQTPTPIPPSTGDLLTFGGLTIVTSGVVQVILMAVRPDPDIRDRFGPVLSIVVATSFALFAAVSRDEDLFNAVLLGIFTGTSASGVYDTLRGLTK